MPSNVVTRTITTLSICLCLAACATSPTGHRQLQLFSTNEMAQLGDESYTQIKQQTPVSQNPAINNYVVCVTQALTRVVPPPQGSKSWKVTVFQKNEANAFALPGGNIGVYTGMLKVTQNEAQLAAVLGHEIGHVEAHHANARLSTEYATQAGLNLVGALAGAPDSATSKQVMSLLGLGAQVGIILPYSRAQETEADQLGLQYMAKAGFDPRQAVNLWQNMEKQASGQAPPQFLSTHPASAARIQDLEKHMPQAMTLYEQAKAQGRNPQCQQPAG